MAEAVRTAPLLYVCLQVLDEADKPLYGRDVLARVGQRVTLTPYEREPYKSAGQRQAGEPRWENHLRWHTGDVATVGWMTKREGYWSLTEAGQTAMRDYDADQLFAEMKRRYKEIRRRREKALETLSGNERFIANAVGIIDPGSWTAYSDVATLAGVDSKTVADFLAGAKTGLPTAYRVLYEDGSVPPDEVRHARHRGMDVMARLHTEGVEFDESGRATQADRVSSDGIRERLSELADAPGETQAVRAWLVRPRLGGAKLVRRWRENGFVSVAGTHLGNVAPGSTRKAISDAVEEGYQHLDYPQRLALANEYYSFLNTMAPDDLVATVIDDQVYLGSITGDPEYTVERDARWHRSVAWKPNSVGTLSQLSAPIPGELEQQGSVVDITGAHEALAVLLGVEPAPSESPDTVPVPASVPPALPAVTGELSAALHLDRVWLQELIDVLGDRQQLVLYGPPGTGKTYLAQKLARHVTGADAVELVQFHPSYAYEDFFEGFRPKEDGSFSLTPGPLRRLASAAREDPDRPYVLVIDEINRANLPKVFGELYFLLEYRNDAIRLQYSPGQAFTLPANVFFIGTMNTADRSIALLDAAMRRRFAFFELHPAVSPVSELLPNWLAANGKPNDRAQLLDALNDAIGAEDRDFQIGPSFLMTPDAERDGGLNRIWRYSILPLLEEHYYGRLTRDQVHARFDLDALRPARQPADSSFMGGE